MNKKLPIIILIGLILILILPVIYLSYRSIAINKATSKLFNTDNCQLQDLEEWFKEIGIKTDNLDYIAINQYRQELINFPTQASFLLPEIIATENQLLIYAKKEYGLNLPKGIEIKAEFNSDQYIKSQTIDLKWGEKNINCSIPLPVDDTKELITISGNLSEIEVKSIIQDNYSDLFANIEAVPETLPLYFPDDIYSKEPNYLILGKEIFQNLFITDYTFLDIPDVFKLNEDSYKLGGLTLSADDFSSQIDMIYSLSKDNYKFDLTQLNLTLLEYLKQKGKTLQLSCSDCLLAPVSKQFSLKSSYSPNVSSINWSGGGNLTAVAKTNLMEMLNEAKAEGINTTIISAYRSYNDQVATFNYWVGKEMANGLTRAQAEIKANNYSAYPGQSEHQLGNTIDIKCSACGSFDNSSGNLALYRYLRENAHSYGFVISYPEGKKDLTGYNSEPWHIRYIGVEAATKLFQREYLESNDIYVTSFLIEENYY